MTELSLRERSKAKRRRAIQLEGMRLFAERGYDATTVADIAEAAEVSARSVSMYFPTKLDIALASSNASASRLTQALAKRLAGESSVDVVARWLADERDAVDEQEQTLRARMFAANPALTATGTAETEALNRMAATTLADDLEVDVTHVAIAVLSGVFAGALQGMLLDTATSPQALTARKAALQGATSAVQAALSDS